MLRPAAVSAAAAAVWLLALLGPGPALPAEDDSSSPGFSLCSHCFYRQTPPRGASAGPPLRPLCHRLPSGQAFATLSRPTCDTAVYSAFHLSQAGAEGEGEEGGDVVTEEGEDNVQVAVPALLRQGGDPPLHVSPADPLLQHWDSTVTTLVQSGISPRCSTVGGDLYILTGAGGLRAGADEDEECQTKPLWSAACCAGPGGKGDFSVGLIREAEEGERQVSVKELEEMLGVAELFAEGCGGGDVQGILEGIHSGNIEKLDVHLSGENTATRDGESDTAGPAAEGDSSATSQNPNEDIKARVAGEQGTGVDAQPEETDVAEGRQKTPAEYETVDEQEEDTNSSSILIYAVSTTFSILTAPLWPVVSTVAQFPEQVTYVLQEDLGVLSALPGDTFSVFHLLTSDLLSWVGSAADMLLSVGETCFSNTYYCTSSMLGALLDSCYTGVTGVGTLAGDTVGIFSGALDNGWWVTKFFGGRLWEQSEGYMGTVVSEMGGQAKAVGSGLGKLVWRSGNGVGKVVRIGGGVIMEVMDLIFGAMRGSSEEESESE